MDNKARTWVLVADGGRVRCLEEKRRGAGLVELPAYAMTHDDADAPSDRDRPTRVHESLGQTRHSVEKALSPHEEEEHRFLLRVGARIGAASQRKLFDRLVIFAPPRALGWLRQALPEPTLRLVDGDRAIDVTGETADEIAARLKQLRQEAQ
jgi:protein required for attachment to host cells